MSMTPIPPYFNRRKIKYIVIAFCTLFAIVCFGAWWAKRREIITLDWSFTLPFIGFLAASISLGIPVADWISKRHSAIDDRLDALETKVDTLVSLSHRSQIERDDLRGRIIRHEVTYRAFLNK